MFRIDLTMTWPRIAEKSLSFECRIDVMNVDLIRNDFSLMTVDFHAILSMGKNKTNSHHGRCSLV